MPGHADLKTTQNYTQVSIRHLKQIHSATHPTQLPKKDAAVSDAKPDEGGREELLNALAAEEEDEEGEQES